MYSAGIVFALSSAVLFGFSNILVRKGFVGIEPRQGIYITVLFSFLSVAVLTLLDGGIWKIGEIGYTALGIYALVGFLNFTVGRSLNYFSISLSGPSVTSTLISMRILFAILFSIVLINETFTSLRIIGDILMFIGITVVTVSNGFEGGKLTKGVIFAFMASAVAGMCDVLISLASTMNSMPMNGLLISYVFGAITYLPLVIGSMVNNNHRSVGSIRPVLIFLIGVGVMSGLAQAARYFSLANAPVSIAVPIISLTPLITMLLSATFLKSEKLGPKFVLGVLVVFIGSVFLSF